MPLAHMSVLLARERAVAAFNFAQLEVAEAIVAGAERAGRGVVLQLSENAVRFHAGLAPIAAAALRLADDTVVPVVVHLDHATDEALVEEAIAIGVTSVMFDAAHLDDAQNIARTREVAERARAADVWIEAELGEVGGKRGAHAPGVRTDVEAAVAFVTATGVDALAVAVGSSHAMTERSARLDEDLIRRLASRVPVPLVLHGSSGVSDGGIRRAVEAGMRKINIGTHIGGTFTRTLRDVLAGDPSLVDPRDCLSPARTATGREVERLVRMISDGTSAPARAETGP